MLAAREDLVDRVSEVAKRKGLTLFSVVNALLEFAIEIDEMGMSLKEVIDVYKSVKVAKKAGFILILENLLYDMAELAYNRAREEALKRWFEAGLWFAKYYITSSLANPLEELLKDLESFAWNISEFVVERAGAKISICMMSPRPPESYIALLASFLEGVLRAFNYEVAEREVSRGILRIEAYRKEGNV